MAIDTLKLATGAGVSLVLSSLGSAKETRVSGVVYGYDPATSLMLLRSRGAHNGVANWRFIPLSSIQTILSSEPTGEASVLPDEDLVAGARREEKAIQWVMLDAERIGDNVSREAQAIFDALCKTMPSKWQGKSVLVLDEVLVEPPYTSEAAVLCHGSRQEVTLQRVRKVLTAERERLGLGL